MKKLELKHLAAYLPYGLQMKLDSDVVWRPNTNERPIIKGASATLTTSLLCDIDEKVYDSLAKFLPILRPLSDLTKPCLSDGKIPIEVFARPDQSNILDLIDDMRNDDSMTCDLLPHYIVEKLFEWHFDVYDLISDGLAIDINTLNK